MAQERGETHKPDVLWQWQKKVDLGAKRLISGTREARAKDLGQYLQRPMRPMQIRQKTRTNKALL
jgi:hypothetical protein